MFTKKAPFQEPNDVKPRVNAVDIAVGQISYNPSFTKPSATQQPQTFIIVFSGGTKTEKKYFSPILIHPDWFPNLIFQFEPDDILEKAHRPRVFTTAYAFQDKYHDSQVAGLPDHYFIVTDVDLFMPHLITEKPVCKSRGIELIVSNPCFEVWTYYSQYSDKFVNFTPSGDPEKLSSELKLYVHKVGPVRVKEVAAFYKMVVNIRNSFNNYSEDQHGMPCVYSTSMHQLATTLLPLVQHVLP